jgi:hypothetical protein
MENKTAEDIGEEILLKIKELNLILKKLISNNGQKCTHSHKS